MIHKLTSLGFMSLLIFGCDAFEAEHRNRTLTPAEVLEDPDHSETRNDADTEILTGGYVNDDSAKFFRTGTEYVYAVAKTVNVSGSDLRKAANYEQISSKFPADSQASEENIISWPGAFTAYSLIASEACKLFLKQDETKEMNLEEMTNLLVHRAFLSQDQADKAIWEANSLSQGQQAAQAKQTTCMTLVASANILY